MATTSTSPVLSPTEGRVPYQSYEKHNAAITSTNIHNLRRMTHATPSEVTERLAELAKEWDMERTLELNASLAAGMGKFHALFR